MPRKSKPHPQITRDIKRIRALTQQARLPDIDEPTRQKLRSLTTTARVRLESGDLHGALTVMCEA